ncbi:protein ELYS-like isoform X2 [Mytilus californianus]|uniref:protein ELYS-like isoform X2 n=1 Tax=Mytilus californianus TaxID=6549 RepID=UPI0022451B83|nr:protein ELYS-like isoform X2 [Mytilus californianus]
MRPGVTPHHVSPLLPFHHGVTDYDAGVFSGVSRDGKFLWLVRGPVIEVLDSTSRRRLAAWAFGVTIKDTHSYITCVKEYCYGNSPKLLVGVCNAQQTSMLCVLDLQSSRLSKVIEIPHKINSVEVVTNVGGDFIPMWALNDQLRLFDGIIAVGTISGIVYLIDMCMDENIHSDEVMPSKLQYITPRSRDTADRRRQAIAKRNHLCLVLDEESHGNLFKYRRCDGTELKSFNPSDVVVTCLKYIPQIGTLVVGFSFGSYQLWRLNVPVLEYSSRVEEDSGSVLNVAYQEPENDPKNFCYLWIIRGCDSEEEEMISSAALYQLAYNKKTWYSNYGAFYEELTSVSLRFDLEMTANLFNGASNTTVSSRAITGYTLEDPNYKPPAKLNEEESFEESVHGPDLSRCLFVWESTESSQKTYQMAVFDMNRWYHAQMPATLRGVGGNLATCSYLSIHSLDEAVNNSAHDELLAVHIFTNSLRKFINTSPLPPEQHFYPASLAFDALLIMDSGLMKCHFLGTQRQVLASIEKIGPSVLLNCKEQYNLCILMGLLPRPLDISSHNPTTAQMREQLLTMALEYNMLPFLNRCIQDWSPGEYVHHGCTLKFVLDWAWSRVVHLKNTIDNTCSPLYDWSVVVLDARSMLTLHHAYQKLSHLAAIFRHLLNQGLSTTEQGFIQLQSKLSVVLYISQHLKVVMWFVRAGLLPEHDELNEHLLPGQYSYPAANLVQAFEHRRQELQKLHHDIGETDLLLVDGMVNSMGPAVRDLWIKEGGSGLYPPPSLHALLNVYLLEGIDLTMKNALVLYSLLDLVSLVDPIQHEQFSQKISKFTKSQCIPISVVKLVQGFWLLDHKDFEESMVVMLDPLVTRSLGEWQHYRIIRSLLYQGDCKMALRYITYKQSPLSSPEEVKIKLTVLLANGLTAEALEYQRTYRDEDNMEDMLQHLFQGCQQTKTMDQLLQLPLTENEERQLIRYLTDSKEPHSLELLVLHYLQRARYVEAIQLNEKLKHAVIFEPASKARERASARNAMVDGFLSVLSAVQRKMVFENQSIPKKKTAKLREVKKPQPLSTTVTKNSHAKIVSRSNLFLEILERVQEVKFEDEAETNDQEESKVGPFVCTPVTPRTRSFFGHKQPVVYMAQQESTQTTSPSTWQPPVQAAVTPYNLSKMMSPVSTKRKGKICGADALSMLQTPVPQRKSLSRSRTSSSVPATPQSILKVRQFISNKSPQISPPESMTKVCEEVPVISAPGTPRSVSFREATIQGTPKQLRFMEPQAEVTKVKSPQSSTKGHKSILRSPPSPKSVKDRSPTPESISRSPKHKSTLDILQRPPLHNTERPYTSHEQPSLEEDTETDDSVMIVDSEITFNCSKKSESEGEGKDSSTEEFDERPNILAHPPAPPAQVTSLKKSVMLTSPVKLKHSPLKTTAAPRSPTVKLTKSPARGMMPPKFEFPEKDISEQDRSPRVKFAEIDSGNSRPLETATQSDEPIEIDDTDEDDVNPNNEKVVSFGVVEEHRDSIHEIDDSLSSDEDLDDKINEIENRITDLVQQEEIEEYVVEDRELKPQNLFKKKDRSVSIRFVSPDSSSGIQESIQVCDESVSDDVTSSDKEETHISSDENIPIVLSSYEKEEDSSVSEGEAKVTTTGEDENLHLELSDENEIMDVDDGQIPSEVKVSGHSDSEAALINVYSNFVDSLSKDAMESEDKCEDENQLQATGIEVEEKVTTPLSDQLNDEYATNIHNAEEQIESDSLGQDNKEPVKVEDSELPPLTEIEENCFDEKRLSTLLENEDDDNLEDDVNSDGEVLEKRSPYKTFHPHKPRTRSDSLSEEPELRRSSRRLSSMSIVEEAEAALPVPKSPGRKKKGEVIIEPLKSPGRKKSALNTESELKESGIVIKSPARRGRKGHQDENAISKSPSRRQSLRIAESVQIETAKSPSRRKGTKKEEDENLESLESKEQGVSKSPGRRKSVKNAEDLEIMKSPGRRKSIRNVEDSKVTKSPDSVHTDEEDLEKVQSPSRRRSTKIVNYKGMTSPSNRRNKSKSPEHSQKEKSVSKSPGRRKSFLKDVDKIEESESSVPKSPGRRKSILKDVEESESSVSKSPGRRKSILKDVDKLEESESTVPKSPGRRKSILKDVDKIKESESSVPKSPGRRKSILKNVDKMEESETTVSKSPGRRKSILKAEDESNSILKSPGRRKSNIVENTKSPGRGRKKGVKIVDEDNADSDKLVSENDTNTEDNDKINVKKSPSRRKKREDSFTEVKSPSRRSVASRQLSAVSDESLSSRRSLRSQSPMFEDEDEIPTEVGDQKEQMQSDGEILTPPDSEMDSPSKSKKSTVTPTRGRRGRQSTTASRRSKRNEDKTETSDLSETESEEVQPVFSFSNPMEVDLPTEDFTKVKEASEVQSFIFSPPAPPRTRKSSFHEDTSQLAAQEHSILLPSTSREQTPIRSREGTPVKSVSKRGRRRKGSSESDVSIPLSIPEEPPGTTTEETDVQSESEPPIKKEKKSRRKKKLLNYDEVNLISPIKEEEGETEVERPLTRQRLRRTQEMPILTLRGAKGTGALPRKKRVAKLW